MDPAVGTSDQNNQSSAPAIDWSTYQPLAPRPAAPAPAKAAAPAIDWSTYKPMNAPAAAPVQPAAVAPPQPPPSQPMFPQGTMTAAPKPGFLGRVRDVVANSGVGHSLESTLPGVADALHLHPTESMASPTYQEHMTSAPDVESLLPAWAKKPLTPTKEEQTEQFAKTLGATPAEVQQGKASRVQAQKEFEQKHPALAGVQEGAQETLQSFSTPENLGLLAAAPESKILAGIFSAQAAHGAYASAQEAAHAYKAGNNKEAAKALTEATLSAGMAVAPVLAHGAHEEKPTLHATNDVEALRESAERQAPALGDAAKAATEGVPGAKLEAVRDSKDASRIQDKAERQEVQPSQVADIAAAKITVPDQAAADKVLEQLHAQMPVEKVEGSVTGEPGKNGVRQVQAIVDTGAPQDEPVKKAEVLIQTPEMNEATDSTHDDYRKSQELRAAGKDAEADALERKIAADHEAAEQAAQDRLNGEPKYKFRSTQTNIPADSEASKALATMRAKIDPQDLGSTEYGGNGQGLEEHPHVTLRYGLKGDDVEGVRRFLEKQAPFDAKLGKVDAFPPSEHSDGLAPLIAHVDAPELHAMEKEIDQHGDFNERSFPDYKPHATIGYVKPEAASKYVGDDTTAGKTFRVNSIAITDRHGNQVEVPLKGNEEAAATDLFGNPVERKPAVDRDTAVRREPVSGMQLDPQRFQYKLNTDSSGVTNLLKGRKWNDDLAGLISVWRDPEDGKLYVVNGHHPFQLAQENHVPDVAVREIDVPTAHEARAVGALQNIAEGRGTALDAAKFFRDSGYTPEKLDDLGISMGEATAANGIALARLDPSLFDQVVSGKLRQGRAIAIGNASADAADQEALLKLIQRAESKGRKVTDDVVDELARMVKGAGQHTATQESLFGTQEMTHNLALEKAEVSNAIRERIGQERRTFQGVADSKKAATLGQVEGQTLQPEKNAEIARQAAQAQELYDKFSTRGGTIDDILNRAAKELAEGGNANAIKQRAYDDVRTELSKTLAGATEPNDRGVQEVAQAQNNPVRAGEASEGRRVPRPPARAGASGDVRGTADLTPARAPKPPEKSAFEPGRQSTPVEVRDAEGNWVRGTLDYFNGGVNGNPRRGRVTLENGFKMNNVTEVDMRPVTEADAEKGPVQGLTSGVGEQTKPKQGAIAVDLDKTLATYDGYKGPTEIGKPIPETVDHVKQLLAEGKDAWVYTARAANPESVPAIKAWTKEHIGQELPVTNVKYPEFERFIDDRAELPVHMQEEKRGTSEDVRPATGAETDTSGVVEDRGRAEGEANATAEGDRNQSAREPELGARPVSEGDRGDQRGGSPAPVPHPELDREQRENEERAAARKQQLVAARGRSLAENAAAHKSHVEDFGGRKALVLDTDGEAVWHRALNRITSEKLRKELGVGKMWRGVSLSREGVNAAIAYLKGGAEDLRVAGLPDSGGFDRMVDLLKQARNAKGEAIVLRGDYRADTAREEAVHDWQREHGLMRSDAMLEVASRPEFQHATHLLHEMGYTDLSADRVAAELMAKAIAGDRDFEITDEERDNLVRSFLSEAVEEKGADILRNLPDVDPRVQPILNEVRRGYDYGDEFNQGQPGDEGGGEPPVRGADGQARRDVGQAAEGPHSGDSERRRSDRDSGKRSLSQGATAPGELKAPKPPQRTGSDEPVFQRAKAPRPVESMALPGMGGDVEAQRESAEQLRDDLNKESVESALHTAKGDVSKVAGEMERNSPLFYGTEASDQGTLFQRVKDDAEARRQNPWFLKSEKLIDQKMKGPMPGEALLRMLENNGVKADELKWSGLEDLRGRARVTPDDVRAHMAENALKVKEVVKGEAGERAKQVHREFNELMAKLENKPIFNDLLRATDDAKANEVLQRATPEERDLLTRYLDNEREARELSERGVRPGGTDAKYGNYTLPGGENYRELLLTIPERPRIEAPPNPELDRRVDAAAAKLNAIGEPTNDPEEWRFWSGVHSELLNQRDRAARKAFADNRAKDFRTNHWDESNILAHVRFNDRTTSAGKRLLHVEEIQSDWHQKGRDVGYQGEATETPEDAKRFFGITDGDWAKMNEAQKQGYVDEMKSNEDHIRKGKKERVPDAPFKKDWHEMAFRRAVKYAADHGYDGVSWTPGEKQAERYDLSQQIEHIRYVPETQMLFADDHNGQEVLHEKVAPEKISDYIGKEAAKKLLDTEPKRLSQYSFPQHVLRDADLKVGGEGMKGFYDKIIADYARKFGKQWGAKVNEAAISTSGGKPTEYEDFADYMAKKDSSTVTVPYLEITPEMRKQVAEQGVSLFQKAKDEENPVAKSVSDLVDDLKAMPKGDKGTALDRVAGWTKDTVEESLERSGKALGGVPSAFEKAFAWAKSVSAALVHDYRHPLEQTDWKRQVGQLQLAQTETAFRLQELAKELTAQAPKPLDRVAMTHYMEAAGNDAKLKEWSAGNKSRAMQAALASPERARYLREQQAAYDRAASLTPEQKDLAKRLRQHFDDMLDLAKQNGLLQFGYRNYVMHLYEKAEAANILHLIDTSELNPDPSFLKRRFYDTFYNAEGGGLTPKSKDIGYLLTAYDKSMNEAIASRNFIRSLLDAKAPDGRPIAAIKTRGGWVIAHEGQMPEVMQQRARPKTLEGYRDFDRPQLRNFLFKPTTEDLEGFDPKLFDEDPERLAFRGDLIIHPKYASRVEDMLTPSWFERGESAPQKIGSLLARGSGLAKEIMTAAAPFHMVQEGVHAMEHKVNPFNLPKIDLSDKTQRLLASHGLTLVNYDAEGLFGTKALKGIGEYIPGVNKAMDALHSFSQWQFQDYIPRLKMRMATEAFERNVKRYPELNEEQVAELTARQSNAAFGNLNTTFDRIPRTKTFKTLLRLATFAPDFLEARMRFVGQAFTKYGGEQRAALIRGALAMYAVARISNAVMNNGDAKWDPEHAFSIVRNGKSYSLRTVQGDILHAVTDPRGFIYNRLNPLTTRPIVEYLSGRDQFGRQKSAVSEVKDLAKSVLPFGAQKVIQTPDEDWLNSILTSTGLESRNYRTPTEEAVHKLYLQHIPDLPDDPEKQAETRRMRQLEDKVRSGHLDPTDVWNEVEKGTLTPAQAARTVQRAQKSRLEIEFQSLGLRDAMKIYKAATPLEQAELRPDMEKKASLVAELPAADQEKAVEQIEEMLAMNAPH